MPSKKALGTACGTERNVICVSILKNVNSKANDQIKVIRDECERLFISSWLCIKVFSKELIDELQDKLILWVFDTSNVKNIINYLWFGQLE